MPKNKKAIKYLTKAAKITKDIFAVISKQVKPGIRENEIAHQIERAVKKKGLRRSFRIIVASGPNAAKPHAKITRRIIKKNDVVIVDFGVIFCGYHSDMSRTIMVGKTGPKINKLYKIVKLAQKMAIKKIMPGLKISNFITEIYTSYIRKNNMGKYILHGLGHGIGIKIHEPPKLSEKNRRILKKGMVVTIEPGLYVKGLGGVRIEDMVLLTESGARILTR